MSTKMSKTIAPNDAAHRLSAVASYARLGFPQRVIFAGHTLTLQYPMTVNRAHRELRKLGVDGHAHPLTFAGGAR